MSKDTIFNEKRKFDEHHLRQRQHFQYHELGFSAASNSNTLPAFEPLAKVYDYRFGYNIRRQKYIRGLIVQIIHAEKAWIYCIRPQNEDAFWTRAII